MNGRQSQPLLAGFFAIALCLQGCGESPKKRYLLAERLWSAGDYVAAVAEFDRVTRRDPRGKLGLQALYRSAMTETLFLSRHQEAIQKFKSYIDLIGESPESWSAQLQIGETLFSKLNKYDEAIPFYKELLSRKPLAMEAPEILFRIARSHFFLWQFSDATARYLELINRFPTSPWSEKAAYEIANTYLTSAEHRPEGQAVRADEFKKATSAYEAFLKKYPQSELTPHALFGIASCLEGMDLLEQAVKKYEELKGVYPSGKVLAIKLRRIQQRIDQRKR